MAKKSLTEQVTEKFDSKKFKEEFKKKFAKITHTPPPEIVEDTTPQVHDWTQRKPLHGESKSQSQSRPTSPKHSYIDRQQKLTKEKELTFSEELKDAVKDGPKNYTAKKKQLEQWLKQSQESALETDAETFSNFIGGQAQTLAGESSSLYGEHYHKNC